jgi:hypothetical protein
MTHLALGAGTTGAVNPDILGDDGALLVELVIEVELY